METASVLRFAAAVVLSTSVSLASGAIFNVVVPGDLATVDGDLKNDYPFDLSLTPVTSGQRYQQVYAASEFSVLPPGGAFITRIGFRVDPAFYSFSNTLPDIQVNLSTTASPVDGLSLTFANNVGLDDVVVFGRGPLALAGTGSLHGTLGENPNPFDVWINLTTAFAYDPAQGNLLLDVRNFGGGTSGTFDASGVAGDGTSRVFTFASGVNSPLADASPGSATWGLVTQFTFEAPEPSSVTLLALGAAAFLCAKRRRAGRR